MVLLRRVARPLLASMFLVGGADALLHPTNKKDKAAPVALPIAHKIPYLPEDPEQLVRINAGVQIVAGTALALGKFPRLSALALAATVLPTTAAGHRFWEEDDAASKANQKVHFFKNVSMLGGLLLAAADTAGKPSLGWRAHHVAGTSRHVIKASKREAKMAAREAKLAAKSKAWKGRAKIASLT